MKIGTLANGDLKSSPHLQSLLSFFSDHAKLLWQRIPKTVKQSNTELGELWEIGKRLWRRDFAAVYALARTPSWPPHLAQLVSTLVGKEKVIL